jgi:hypothetical protein
LCRFHLILGTVIVKICQKRSVYFCKVWTELLALDRFADTHCCLWVNKCLYIWSRIISDKIPTPEFQIKWHTFNL